MFRLMKLFAALLLAPVLCLMKAQARILEGTTTIRYPPV